MRYNKKLGWRGRDQNSSQEGLYLNLKKKKEKETKKQIVHAEFQMYYRFYFFFHCLNTRRVTRHNNSTPLVDTRTVSRLSLKNIIGTKSLD